MWIQDREKFAEYQEMAKATQARKDIHVERWLVTDNIEGEGIDKPDEIVITWYDNAEGFRQSRDLRSLHRLE